MSSRDDRLRLLDILKAIDDIDRHVGDRAKETVFVDNTAIDAIAYRLVIIGEAVVSLPTALLTSEGAIP